MILLTSDLSVQIEADNQCLIDCLRPLPTFASHDVIDESAAHQLPDIYPIAPTIDLKHEHIYQMVDHSGRESLIGKCLIRD